jgi:prolyl 4-hydroxylase
MAKARSFLGFFDYDEIEVPQLTKYGPSQEYRAHYDWPPVPWREVANGNQRFDRFSTFFVYLQANCSGGSTHFPHVYLDDVPHLDAINDTKFEVISEKDGETVKVDEGGGIRRSLAVRPIAGNAVFWVNMVGQGKGNEKTFHAGMPVAEGRKVGLNIWSRRYYPDDEGVTK